MGWWAAARTTMVSVVHMCSDCEYLCFSSFFPHIHREPSVHSHQFDFTKLSLAIEIHVARIIFSFFCVIPTIVWFWRQPGFVGYSKSLTLSVYTESNMQVSVYKSWLEEMAIHQYTRFLETSLLPLLHRSAWPLGLLLSLIRGAQKLDNDIAFQGWALPVQDASSLWHSRQIQWALRATSTV